MTVSEMIFAIERPMQIIIMHTLQLREEAIELVEERPTRGRLLRLDGRVRDRRQVGSCLEVFERRATAMMGGELERIGRRPEDQ